MKIVYRTDELENAIDYLEQVAHFYLDSQFQHRFKWLMITLHGALYGFGVLAIKGTNAAETIYKDFSMKKGKLQELRKTVAELHDETDEGYINIYVQAEHGQLLAIYDILEKCQTESYMNRYYNSKKLILSEEQKVAINQMIIYRNQFAHFKPALYAIMGDYIIDVVYPVLEVIKFLALDSHNVMYYEKEQEDRVQQALEKVLASR